MRLSAIIGIVSAINPSNCPPSIETGVRNLRIRTPQQSGRKRKGDQVPTRGLNEGE
jgi:hypothetical protein